MDKISFQGNTKLFFDPEMYARLCDNRKNVYRNLSTNNKCKLTNCKVFATTADDNNIAVLVRNEKNGFLKFVPVKSFERIIEEIAIKTDELRRTAQNKLTAWIIGGGSIESQTGDATIRAVNRVADILCDQPDIDASILASSKLGEEKFAIHTKLDQVELIFDKKLSSKEPALDQIDNMFDIVEFNNTDLIN